MCLDISRLRLFFRKPCKIAQAKKKTKRTFRFSHQIVAYLHFISLSSTEPALLKYIEKLITKDRTIKKIYFCTVFLQPNVEKLRLY